LRVSSAWYPPKRKIFDGATPTTLLWGVATPVAEAAAAALEVPTLQRPSNRGKRTRGRWEGTNFTSKETLR
jgi:hypothetical protein